VVAPTSRSAIGADLLATDNICSRAWFVQVKTSSKPGRHWLLGKKAEKIRSGSHMCVFVDRMEDDQRPGFYVVPSGTVAAKTKKVARPGSMWYRFDKDAKFRDDWRVFGGPASDGD
jgi:hypothetical protein